MIMSDIVCQIFHISFALWLTATFRV